MKKIKRLIVFSVLFAAGIAGMTVKAESKNDRLFQKHEVRIGWGDQMFESLVWHNPTAIATSQPQDMQFLYKENYRYSQHYFLEYQYRFNHWFGLGAMVDGSGVTWDVVKRNGSGEVLGKNEKQYFYNLVVMPTARFTYLHHAYVNMYSGLGLGMNVNGGTEVDSKGRHTLVAPALNVTILGLSFNYKRFFFATEFGGMTSLLDRNTIFLVKSRMFTASLGCRF